MYIIYMYTGKFTNVFNLSTGISASLLYCVIMFLLSDTAYPATAEIKMTY